MKNRKGIVLIDNLFYKDEEGLLVLSVLFSMVIPFFIREDFDKKEVFCVSKYFDIVEEGAKIPHYEVKVTKGQSENKYGYAIAFNKVIF